MLLAAPSAAAHLARGGGGGGGGGGILALLRYQQLVKSLPQLLSNTSITAVIWQKEKNKYGETEGKKLSAKPSLLDPDKELFGQVGSRSGKLSTYPNQSPNRIFLT